MNNLHNLMLLTREVGKSSEIAYKNITLKNYLIYYKGFQKGTKIKSKTQVFVLRDL